MDSRLSELQLSDFAVLWCGQPDGEERDETVRQYQAILRCMIDVGYNDSLAADSELPEELVPQLYFDLF